jgi:hypothetical protein
MKRGDPLKEIEEILRPCNGTYKSHREKIAKKILDKLEELGMAPPEVEGAIETGRFYKRYWEESE